MMIRATPFHARTAAANRLNRWTARNGFTLASDFGSAQDEARAARARVGLIDISWRWRMWLEGVEATPFLSRLVTREASVLAPGGSLKALWLNDGGAVRGAGVVARFASDKYMIASAGSDPSWFEVAATPFSIAMTDVTDREGGLALVGPHAETVLREAGLQMNVAPLGFQKLFWRGLDVMISRWGEQSGYEIWCAADDCLLVWDRLMKAGAAHGIQPAGLDAADILDIEAGVPRPARDYLAANDGFVVEPSPGSLGLESLIDEQHLTFNGRAAWLANREKVGKTLAGVEIESETPAPFAVLRRNGMVVGHTLSSVRSPTLQRAIALAQIERASAKPGIVLSLAQPLSLGATESRDVKATVAELPFITRVAE